jgi:hypothetical protein
VKNPATLAICSRRAHHNLAASDRFRAAARLLKFRNGEFREFWLRSSCAPHLDDAAHFWRAQIEQTLWSVSLPRWTSKLEKLR